MSQNSSQTLKNKARKRDNNTCQKCGYHNNDITLDVHHMQSLSHDGEDTLENMITLCHFCHKFAPYTKAEFDEYLHIDMIKEEMNKIINDEVINEMKNYMNENNISGDVESFVYSKISDFFHLAYEISYHTRIEGRKTAEERGIVCTKPKKEIDKTELIGFIDKGLSATACGKIFDSHPNTIISRLKEWGYVLENNKWIKKENSMEYKLKQLE